MLKRIIRNKKAQQTAEYALLISLVVAAVIAMQTYAQRTIQARIRDASLYLTQETVDLGNTNQYEPYYLETDYTVTSSSVEEELQYQRTADDSAVYAYNTESYRTRGANGYQIQTYNEADLEHGI